MLNCSNVDCKFWLHKHEFDGVSIAIGDACPWCGSVLDGTPQDPVWDVQPIDVFDARTGKVNLTKLQGWASEQGVTIDDAKRQVVEGCVPCKDKKWQQQ